MFLICSLCEFRMVDATAQLSCSSSAVCVKAERRMLPVPVWVEMVNLRGLASSSSTPALVRLQPFQHTLTHHALTHHTLTTDTSHTDTSHTDNRHITHRHNDTSHTSSSSTPAWCICNHSNRHIDISHTDTMTTDTLTYHTQTQYTLTTDTMTHHTQTTDPLHTSSSSTPALVHL